MRRLPTLDGRTYFYRVISLSFAAIAATTATTLMVDATIQDGVDLLDILRGVLILVTTAWLAWGAAQAFLGLASRTRRQPEPELSGPVPATVVLVPICNEDPVSTFARIAAMDSSLRDAQMPAHIAILSDTRDEQAAAAEYRTYLHLIDDTDGAGRIFYRRRTDNRGRKAGNIEDFIRKSGGAYELAVILDADSLMEGALIKRMVARMAADPNIGLLQTLPKIVNAHSFFGRAMQFAASFHSPVFSRGLARMQGSTGPFWGHNAIIRVRAFAESCGLPELSGEPPFGGHILSHDYVEAALLARNGWVVKVDETLEGSYEEGPENILAYARRDRRWCQGNLQHSRLLFSPGFRGWSRFVFVQGIFSYLVSLVWACFLVASVLATIMAPLPDYFPEPYQLFPVFPDDRTKEITALFIGIVGLLIVPKFLILFSVAQAGKIGGFGGTLRAAISVTTEIVLSSFLAPLMLMYQSRAVLQVLSGRDGGWPANQRAEGALSLWQGIGAGMWITGTGAIALTVVHYVAPDLTLWLLPVCLPMLLAPLLISLSSRAITHAIFRTPEEVDAPEVVTRYHSILTRWQSVLTASDDKASKTEHAAA